MKPNVLLIGLRAQGLEDEVTAYWHYLLDAVPGLGQAFVDHVCPLSGLATWKCIGALDQPVGDKDNHPDLLLQCRDFELLFEHKLDSPLGPQQLQRYVDLARRKRWKLALMAARRIEIDDGVKRSGVFIYPKVQSVRRTFSGRTFGRFCPP